MNTSIRQLLVFVCAAIIAIGIFGCGTKKYVPANQDTNEKADSSTETDTDSAQINSVQLDQTVFSQEKILEYHITIDDELLKDMQAHGNDEVYRNASLKVLGEGIDETFSEVGFRFKGAWSLHHCWDDNLGVRSYEGSCERLSTKIKFNKYDKDARLFGLKRLNLHAVMGDATKLRDRLSYSLFNDFGVVAPRTAHAKLYINNAFAGLVMAIEQVDGRFTHFRFPQGDDGNLFKELWPSPNVDENWALSRLKTNDAPEDNPDVSDFLNFKDAIAASTKDTFSTQMTSWLDLDNILRYIAVDRAIRNWDGIMGFYSSDTSHNFYWYHDDGDANKFHLIPWDLDNTMGEFDMFMDPQLWCDALPVPDWNETPLNCDSRPICTDDSFSGVTPPRCDHFIDMLAQTQWTAFTKIGDELLSSVLSYQSMDQKITVWAAQIAETIDEDPLLDVAAWEQSVEQFRVTLKDAIYDFEKHIEEGLIDEVIPTPLDDTQLGTPIAVGALRVDIINNFEFETATPDSLNAYLFSFASTGTSISQQWNNNTPILGNGDLQLNADFQSTQGAWSEYAGYLYATEQETDINQFSSLWFSASANTDTRVRVEFRSNAYADFGDIYEMFSKEFTITQEPQFFRIDIPELSYPQWAKDNWGLAEGWDVIDAEALETILAKFDGLGFQLFPPMDDNGQMLLDTAHTSVQIDNIYFE